MFTVAVKDHVMIAHSFRGEVFGPARRLHGATYGVTAEFRARELDPDNIVLDIGHAFEVLDRVLEPLRYRNLDELDRFTGQNTTTEFLARHLHEQIADEVRGAFRGSLRVVLEESPRAWCAYEGDV
jgi:6-pyruvoyl-tetrahydropterin synthase